MNKRKQKLDQRQPSSQKGTMTGKLSIARNGAGYLVDPVTDTAVWIEPSDLGTALPDDTVTIKLIQPGSRLHDTRHPERDHLVSGRIIRIETRAPRAIVGTVVSTDRFIRVQPLSPSYRQEFLAPSANGAVVNDRVVLRFTRWTNERLAPEGEITDIIGPADNPSLDTLSVLKQYDLPEAFPPDVLDAAEKVSSLADHPGQRLDLRKTFVFTCDPESARDYDDALSLEIDEEGRRVLGVHIADVSHYVRPGSPLDREAYKRSTSVYLVDKVVPMLPEQLSNGVCSLVPDADRLTFSAFLTYDAKGNCVARRFAKSVIRSKARFTYEEVMALISDAAKPADAATPRPPRVVKALKGLRGTKRAAAVETILKIHALAQQLRKRRFTDGALDMEVPEAEILLNDRGVMTGVMVRPYDDSHQLVEECMVAANEAVAKELWSRGVKIMARLHEPPDPEKLQELRANLAKIGISCGDLSNQANLARFLKKIKDTPLAGTINVMVLRSMKRAVYSAIKIGHYGLAKKFYAHFTSPIRRYPDLTLHRQLASWLEGKGGREDPARLARAALNATTCEQVADDAERTLVEIKKFRFLEAQVHAPIAYDAVIGKCAHYGLFVDIPELAVGGMIHISNLADDYVRFDAFNETLSAGGKTWKVGDAIKVRIKEVDFAQRKLDFVPDYESTSKRRSPHRGGPYRNAGSTAAKGARGGKPQNKYAKRGKSR